MNYCLPSLYFPAIVATSALASESAPSCSPEGDHVLAKNYASADYLSKQLNFCINRDIQCQKNSLKNAH